MPSAPPTTTSSRFGCRATAATPPLSAPGVIDVMLSTNRCVATSVSFTVLSRPTEIRCDPNGVVGASEGELLAVRRPARAIERVEADGLRQEQFLLGDVPNLNFAHAAG